jgi:hypothetical protein
METVALRLAYRPLRIGWCVRQGNWDDFHTVARLACAVWGGTFGPIIPVESPIADTLVGKFAVDVLYLADAVAPELSSFSGRYGFLNWPYLRQDLFQIGHAGREPAIVDVLPAIEALGREPKGKLAEFLAAVEQHAAAIFEISQDDPLRHVIVADFGAYPPPEVAGTSYVEAVQAHLGAEIIPKMFRSAGRLGNLWTPTRISRYGLAENVRLRTDGGDGIFAGSVDSFDDLVTFWNVRALGADVQFYDPREERLSEIAIAQIDRLRGQSSGRKFGEPIGVWCHHENELEQAVAELVGTAAYPRVADQQWWSGIPILNPPTASKSYVLPTVTTAGRAELTFQLPAPPFAEDSRHHLPLVAISIEPMGDFVETSDLTIWTPHIPALNPFYGGMYISRHSIRSAPDGFAVIVNLGVEIVTLYPLQRPKLLEEVFSAFGMTAQQSDAGRVTTRLIRQMGSILACAVFKLRGVRRLIARHSPLESFTRGAATKLIHDESGITEGDSIATLDDVHLGNRRLTADAAFDFLLSRGVFRVGLNLRCPLCTLEFWIAVDDLKSVATCEYCGEQFLIAMQLKDRDWRYRRSGLFGKDDSQHGGIPVALTIHQLTEGLHFVGKYAFKPGMSLSSSQVPGCETDVALLVERAGTPKSLEIVIGECKSEGGEITQQDVQNMAAIADAFPSDEVHAFIVFAKTGEFSDAEVERCRTAQRNPPRVILLSRREIEPTFVYRRAAKQFEIKDVAISLNAMARNTVDIFFDPKPRKTNL